MAYDYIKTQFVDSGTYGANVFNNMETGIGDAHTRLNEMEENGIASVGFDQKQTLNMANALNRLRGRLIANPDYSFGDTDKPVMSDMEGDVKFCFMGDSVFYAFSEEDDAIPETCVGDNGSPLDGYKRSSVTIYDSFIDVMKNVYGEDIITLIKKVYTGDDCKRASARWNASEADFIIMNYGINDAIGNHVSKSYRGRIDEFIKYYRVMIEREIENGTAVILMSPVKQTVKQDASIKDRMLIDVYEQAVANLAKDYGIPFVNGNDMIKNFDNSMSIDFTHFTKDGFKAVGYRLASIFMGQTPNTPLEVHSNEYIGCNPQLDNINLVGSATLTQAEYSPNIAITCSSEDLYVPIERVEGGLMVNLQGMAKTVWSFYCPTDNMVVVPSFLTKSDNQDVEVSLDFGAKQGRVANWFNRFGVTPIDRSYEEAATVVIKNADMEDASALAPNAKVYGIHSLTADSPVLHVTTKGWHTVTINLPLLDSRVAFSSPPTNVGNGQVDVFGLNFLSLQDYKSMIG